MRRLRRDADLHELSRLLPACGVLIVWTVLMFKSGGFKPATWMPAGLVIVGLLAVAIMGGGEVLPRARAARHALLVLVALAAWCFLSLLWSDAPGTTWEASNMLLVGVASAWTLALAPWRARTAQLFMVAFAAAAAAACLAALLTALQATDLSSRFEDYRFSPPLDYPNTTAALCFIAVIPVLLLASRPDASMQGKAVAQGLATFLGSYALLPQSRGSILGGLVVMAILLLAVPFRWRLTLHALLLAAAMAGASSATGSVYTAAAGGGDTSGALGDSLTAILLVSFGAAVAGLALAYAEDRVELEERGLRLARLGGYAVAGLVALAIVGAGVARSSSISDSVNKQWRSLKHPGIAFADTDAAAAGGHFTSLNPYERYDYWRVSLKEFRANPILGAAAGGFAHGYTEARRYPKTSQYPHNLVMKVLGDTGIVGVGLAGAFLVLVGRALLTRLGRLATRTRVVMAAAAAALGYFLAHGMLDWLEAYPVLVGPALAFPLVAMVVRARDEDHRRNATGHPDGVVEPEPATPRLMWAAAAVGLLLAFISLLGPWLSLSYRDRATEVAKTNTALAFVDLDRAADLNPLDPQPYVLKGVIALTHGDPALARDSFRRALQREDLWLPHFGLAVLAADARNDDVARRELAAARHLNRLDENLPTVSKRLLTKNRPDPLTALREVLTHQFAAREKIT